MLADLPRGLKFLTVEDFESFVGDHFSIDVSGGEPLALRLDRLVTRNGPAFLPRAPFFLYWSTAPSIRLMQGNYLLRQRGWGPHAIYIEPMQPREDRFVYESVFF